MIFSVLAEAARDHPEPWIGPVVVAAVVSGLVALIALTINLRRDHKERQRELFANAFAACQAYREYPYMVRRRISGRGAVADRTRLTTGLSEVQRALNAYRARLRVEAPRVGVVFDNLVDATRRIAGAEISRSWRKKPVRGDQVSIRDIDLTALNGPEEMYVRAVADHLSVVPTTIRRWFRRAPTSERPVVADDQDLVSGEEGMPRRSSR